MGGEPLVKEGQDRAHGFHGSGGHGQMADHGFVRAGGDAGEGGAKGKA
jgi:hypothetical protein